MNRYVLRTPIGKLRVEWRQPDHLAQILLPCRETAAARAGGPVPGWLQAFAGALKEYFAGGSPRFDLDLLDLGSTTPFRQQVYRMVATIPAGSVMSYGEVAAAVGSPGAARAVGSAMANNPFPIVVPCHRVIAANGGLGGFGGGLPMKRWLLRHEGVTDDRVRLS